MDSRDEANRTTGRLGSLIFGVIMSLAGGYLITNQVVVSSSFWGLRYHLFGGLYVSAFGITLIPFLLGVGLVFYNVHSKLGWILAGASLLAIFVGILANLNVYFARTTLYITLVMLVLLIGGVGLIVRALLPRL